MSDTSNLNLNSTKDAARPSQGAVESHTGMAPESSSEEKLDKVAMEGAKRAQNRIHADEEQNPEDKIFSNM